MTTFTQPKTDVFSSGMQETAAYDKVESDGSTTDVTIWAGIYEPTGERIYVQHSLNQLCGQLNYEHWRIIHDTSDWSFFSTDEIAIRHNFHTIFYCDFENEYPTLSECLESLI